MPRRHHRKKKKKDPNAPKKPMTAFMLWNQDNREQTKLENPGADFAELGKLLGMKWRALPEEERVRYDAKAAQAKLEYQKAKEDYEVNKASSSEEDSSSSDESDDHRRRKRRKKDPSRPKAALSAFMFFSKKMRPEIKDRHPDAQFGDIGKMVGEAWKALSDGEKKEYFDLADSDKQRFARELDMWKSKGDSD